MFGGQRIHQFAQRLTSQYLWQLVEREIDAMIGDAALREIIGADALAALAAPDHELARGGDLRALLLLLFFQQARAQNLYGTLTGNVTDASAAPVPGARVQATNMETGVSREVLTDERGVYSLSDLQTGAYRLTIRSAAFAPFTRDGIPVTAGNVRRAPDTL